MVAYYSIISLSFTESEILLLYYSQSLATDTDPLPAAANKRMKNQFLEMKGNFGVTEQLLVFQERLCARIAIRSHLNYPSKIVVSD